MPQVIEKFGEEARIHVPVHWTHGALIDNTMPVGTTWPAPRTGPRGGPAEGDQPGDADRRLTLPFVAIESGNGSVIEISSRTTANSQGGDKTGISMPFSVTRRPPSVKVERTREGFVVTFTTRTDETPVMRTIASIDEAIDTHVKWIYDNYQGRTLADQIAAGDAPAWTNKIPLAVTFDMWLPNGEVAHNYAHLASFCREMASLGVPPGVVIYIPGWVGPYDAGYPYYKPVPELGGRSAFGDAMDAAHAAGYRVMAHTLGWGSDPYVPGFEKHTQFVMRNPADPENPPPPIVHDFQFRRGPDVKPAAPAPADDPLRGPYGGWPGGGDWHRIASPPLTAPVETFRQSANGWLFDSPEVPERCEAVVSLAGMAGVGAAVVRLSINGRTLTTPAGWFSANESYSFPFTFLLKPGVNPVEVTVFGAEGNAGGVGEGSVGPKGSVTFSIDEMYGHNPKQNIWTQPAVGAVLDDPRWHDAFCEHLVPTVEEFGIDLVHIDATSIWRWDDKGLFAELKRRLPSTTCFGTEVASEAGMGFFMIKQTRVPSGGGGAFSNVGGSDGQDPGEPLAAWRPKQTDLPLRFSSQYGHFYAHLCSGRGFVPHYTSCSINPLGAALTSADVQLTHEFMRRSLEAHIIPTLRVNYRDYGIDDETRKFLEEMIISGA